MAENESNKTSDSKESNETHPLNAVVPNWNDFWEEEYRKCQGDPVYFYEFYVTVNGVKQPFLTDAQKEFLRKTVK